MQSESEYNKNKHLGRLKYGNPSGDFSKAPRCRAMTRRGTSCLAPAMPNGRCRMHGGKSTGPKTIKGRQSIRFAHLKHGRYSMQNIKEQRELHKILKFYKDQLKIIE